MNGTAQQQAPALSLALVMETTWSLRRRLPVPPGWTCFGKPGCWVAAVDWRQGAVPALVLPELALWSRGLWGLRGVW